MWCAAHHSERCFAVIAIAPSSPGAGCHCVLLALCSRSARALPALCVSYSYVLPLLFARTLQLLCFARALIVPCLSFAGALPAA
eukprot:3972450-Alexandrium_andersonii.AAC.1